MKMTLSRDNYREAFSCSLPHTLAHVAVETEDPCGSLLFLCWSFSLVMFWDFGSLRSVTNTLRSSEFHSAWDQVVLK